MPKRTNTFNQTDEAPDSTNAGADQEISKPNTEVIDTSTADLEAQNKKLEAELAEKQAKEALQVESLIKLKHEEDARILEEQELQRQVELLKTKSQTDSNHDYFSFEIEVICNQVDTKENVQGGLQESVELVVDDDSKAELNGNFSFTIDEARAHGLFVKGERYLIEITKL